MSSAGAASLTAVRDVAPARTEPVARLAPRYAVVLHNDDVHTFDYVIEVLQEICLHPRDMALQMALDAHHAGRRAIWTGSLEVAELKRDQIRTFGPDPHGRRPVADPLVVTLEPLRA